MLHIFRIIFLDSIKLKFIWINITKFFKRRVSVIIFRHSIIRVSIIRVSIIRLFNHAITATSFDSYNFIFALLCKEFCKENFNIKLVFNSFKIKNYFSYKDPIPNDLKSFLVYKFTCASCSSSCIGETCRHFKTRIVEHIK